MRWSECTQCVCVCVGVVCVCVFGANVCLCFVVRGERGRRVGDCLPGGGGDNAAI